MAEAAVERLRRILVMVPWIHAHPGIEIADLCGRFGVDRETLMADLDAIQCSGIPPFTPYDMIEVWVEGERVTLRMAEHVSTPPRLTRSEAREVVIRARAVASLPGLGEAASLRTAIDKLTVALGDDDGEVSVDLDVPGAEHVGAMRAAIAAGQRLHLAYYSHGRGEMTEREIDPLLVVYANGAWYAFAYDAGADEQRTFRLDRIRELRPTGEPAAEHEPVDADAYAAGSLVAPTPDDIEVTIDLTPRGAWIAEAVPHERATKRPEGTVRLRLRTAHLAWLVRLLLSAGADARAVSPPELREAVGEAARAALAAYGEDVVTRER